ncbi:putative lactoylglutathione lyase [Mucilaginibacter sp. UYP25]|uniref:VOC family protein n=1 Tax=unclassified Mucilaginibacter TaxID=2617802 RepID=UPI003396AABC
MTKELWMNLPVKNIDRSIEFFKAIGFDIKDGPGSTATSVALSISEKNIIVMLFQEDVFKNITQNGLVDTSKATEVMFSFGAESREEVDEVAKKVTAAGGNVFAPPAENQGWMYGCAFADPDGHRWNALFMDMSKMPK